MINYLPPEEPPISFIIPYKQGNIFNPIYICENDEAIIVEGGKSIGHARIIGAKLAKNNWIVQMDSDAFYPKNYVYSIKYFIKKIGNKYPIMGTIRKGGFNNVIWNPYDHGLVVKKDIFLEKTKNYNETGHRDIAKYFQNAYIIPVYYYHNLTKGEKFISISIGLTAIGLFSFVSNQIKH